MDIKLTAKLDHPGGTVLQCGRCGEELGGDINRDFTPEIHWVPGYTQQGGGRGKSEVPIFAPRVWRLSKHSQKSKLVRGRYATRRRHDTHGRDERPIYRGPVVSMYDTNFPILVQCPQCTRLQWISAELLLDVEKV